MSDDANVNQEAALAKSGGTTPEDQPANPGQQVIPPEILDKLPPEARHIFELSMMQMGPMPNPLLQHVNSSHIDKALDNAEKTDARQAEAHKVEVQDRKHNRITTWVGLAIIVIILGGLWAVVPAANLGSLKEIIMSLIALGAVGFGGYGYALSKMKERE